MTRSFGKQMVGVAKLQVLTVIIGLFTQIYLARLLGPEQKGILDLFLLAPAILASLIDLGLLSANTYFGGKRQISVRVLHSHSLYWALIASCLLIGAGLLLHDPISRLFKGLSGWSLLAAVALAGPTMYISLWSSLMYGIDRVRIVYVFNTVAGAGALLLYFVLGTLFGSGMSVFLVATTILTIAKAITAFLISGSESAPILGLDVGALKKSLRYGFPLYFGLIVNALHFRLSQIFVNLVTGASDLANFALATRIAEMMWLMDYAIINASIFRITSTNVEEAAEITKRMSRIVGSMIFLASFTAALAAPVVIPLIFGEAFSPTVTPLIILLPGVLLWSLGRILAQFIAYQMGRSWLNMGASVAAFVVNVVLMILLVPRFGIIGAAVATSLSYACNYSILAQAFLRITKVEISSIMIPTREDLKLAVRVMSDQVTIFRHKQDH